MVFSSATAVTTDITKNKVNGPSFTLPKFTLSDWKDFFAAPTMPPLFPAKFQNIYPTQTTQENTFRTNGAYKNFVNGYNHGSEVKAFQPVLRNMKMLFPSRDLMYQN